MSNPAQKNGPLDRIAKALKARLPAEGWAFACLIYQFPTSGKGQVMYVGNGPKPDTLGAMKQFVVLKEPGIAWLNSRDTAFLIEQLNQADCTCVGPAKCNRCVGIGILKALPKPEQTLHDAMADCQQLATYLVGLDCGWPRVDEKHPQGMSLFEAVSGYIEELRTKTSDTKPL